MDDTDRIVLVVDDEKDLLRFVELVLRRAGYVPITASRGSEALDKARQFGGDIHALVTDIMMPEMDCLTLVQKMLVERPQLRVLLISGYTDLQSRLPFLPKPFDGATLADAVARVLAGPPADIADAIDPLASAGEDPQEILLAELEEARARYMQASRAFSEISNDVPSGVPATDGLLRVQISARERRRAYAEYRLAKKRLDDYECRTRPNGLTSTSAPAGSTAFPARPPSSRE